MNKQSRRRLSNTIAAAGTLAASVLLLASWASYLDVRPSPTAQKAASTASRTADGKTSKPLGRQFESAYDKQMVKDRVSWNYLGKRTADVALINATEGADLQRTARECLKRNLAEHEFAQCYVFDSEREYGFKNISGQLELPKGTPATGLVILCYEVLGRQEPGKPPVIANMRDAPETWRAQGCPGW